MRAVLVDLDRPPASPLQHNGRTACSKEGQHRLVVMPTARPLSLSLKDTKENTVKGAQI